MIDVKELRIGNLVYMGQYIGVEPLSAYNIYQLTLLEKGNNHVADFYHGIKPIELTEEWLKKLGFRLETFPLDTKSSNPCYFKPEGCVKISMTDTNDMFWFSYNYTNRKIKYVHQLQNLYFALTNEELTIKN